jgi:hypothetical protein
MRAISAQFTNRFPIERFPYGTHTHARETPVFPAKLSTIDVVPFPIPLSVPDRRYPGSQPPRPGVPVRQASASFNLIQSNWRAMVPPVFLSSHRIPCFGGNSIPVGESRDTRIPLNTAHPRISVHSVCSSRPVPCASLIGRTLFRNRTASVPTFPPEWKEHVLKQPMKRWHFCNYPVLVLMFLKHHLSSIPRI